LSVLAHEGTYPILYGSYGVPVGSGHVPGYLARPDQAGRFPTVLVLPETRLTSHHKDLSRRLARHGLATVAIDLPDAVEDAIVAVDEAYEFVMVNDWAIERHLGVLGLGSGGRAGLVFAADQTAVRALALVSTPLEEDGPVAMSLPRLAVPVLGLYGAEAPAGSRIDDGRIQNGAFIVYEGVDAEFMDDGAAQYDAAASADAHRRLIAFFDQHLPVPQLERMG
jgi:dienelactone hydrolase